MKGHSLSTWRKKIFSNASVKIFLSFSPQNIWILSNLREIKDSSLRMKNFQKIYFEIEMLGKCLPTVKKHFQLHHPRFLFVTQQNTRILLVLLMLFWEWKFFKKIFAIEVLGMCLTYLKKLFSIVLVNFFFFKAQNTRILSFLVMPVWEKSRATAWK